MIPKFILRLGKRMSLLSGNTYRGERKRLSMILEWFRIYTWDKMNKIKWQFGAGMVAHFCNRSYFRGRDRDN
jgi:hypothetical protein